MTKVDPSLLVYDWIDDAPKVNVFQYLTTLVLDRAKTDASPGVFLAWNDGSGDFSLWVDGNEIDDLVTGEDEWKRPTFIGGFDDKGNPGIEGVVDVTADGDLMVEIIMSGFATARHVVHSGAIVATGTCECAATYVTHVCVARDCQGAPVNCSSTNVKCAWQNSN